MTVKNLGSRSFCRVPVGGFWVQDFCNVSLFTARIREELGRLCYHRCLSVTREYPLVTGPWSFLEGTPRSLVQDSFQGRGTPTRTGAPSWPGQASACHVVGSIPLAVSCRKIFLFEMCQCITQQVRCGMGALQKKRSIIRICETLQKTGTQKQQTGTLDKKREPTFLSASHPTCVIKWYAGFSCRMFGSCCYELYTYWFGITLAPGNQRRLVFYDLMCPS